ncbi:hypothetical protein CMUS01_04355 [Colletotrichum musicola]|uniref:Uncharacterized protein n=2 Tax=Colletotrichum orchidearum species complex TaxID=2707337 RepID=A0A8H6KXL2_9PEZI|nr:hypothetical protein CPLU01_03612 [Colletotrichum plurivorum]KAF6839160.1 hypothetical protein CMUS01_04355 [Colletotrichum musicola]
MKLVLALAATAAVPAVAESCTTYFAKNVATVSGGITWTFNNENAGHWSWNADIGDGVIQDDAWLYFDGKKNHNSAVIRISYKDGTSGLIQPPNGRDGWCTIPAGKQNNIASVVSWAT